MLWVALRYTICKGSWVRTPVGPLFENATAKRCLIVTLLDTLQLNVKGGSCAVIIARDLSTKRTTPLM